MKLVGQILVAPLVATTLLIASALVSDRSTSLVAQQFQQLREQKLSAAADVADLRTRISALNTEVYRGVLLAESLEATTLQTLSGRVTKETDAMVRIATGLADRVPADQFPQIKAVEINVAKYRDSATRVLNVATGSPGAAASMLASAERSFAVSFKALETIAGALNSDVTRMSDDVVAVAAHARRVSIGMTVAAVVASVLLAWILARRIVRRIDAAIDTSEAISRGELDQDPAVVASDELGRLQQSLANTVTRLRQSMHDVQQASHSVALAASEIASGNADMSTRTERTAGNLQFTASSMSEVTEELTRNAAEAQAVLDLAREASNLAQHGGATMTRVVDTMRDIQSGANRMAEITSLIDGIAFQTNILALNAAVEAARAGEQGRGFAVVASEVRSLAQRSATAAKEIRTLLATAAEQADSGTLLVGEAGQAMGEIVKSVEQVGRRLAALSSDASAQSARLRGVNESVHELEAVTQENSAMVEQTAAASESLKTQSVRLTEVLQRFRLQSGQAIPA